MKEQTPSALCPVSPTLFLVLCVFAGEGYIYIWLCLCVPWCYGWCDTENTLSQTVTVIFMTFQNGSKQTQLACGCACMEICNDGSIKEENLCYLTRADGSVREGMWWTLLWSVRFVVCSPQKKPSDSVPALGCCRPLLSWVVQTRQLNVLFKGNA